LTGEQVYLLDVFRATAIGKKEFVVVILANPKLKKKYHNASFDS
jgi:hypothetical protein